MSGADLAETPSGATETGEGPTCSYTNHSKETVNNKQTKQLHQLNCFRAVGGRSQ